MNPTPPVTPTPTVSVSPPIIVSTNYTVGQGNAVYFLDTAGFSLEASLTNAGVITDIDNSAGGGATAVASLASLAANAAFDNQAGGDIYVEATGSGASATGLGFSGVGPTVENDGLIQVVSTHGAATGEVSTAAGVGYSSASTGSLVVWGSSAASGLVLTDGGPVANAGSISVTGPDAIGVSGATSFNNSGSIIATNTTGALGSIAVDIPAGSGSSYTNSGTIEATYAFRVEPGTQSPEYAPGVTLNNSGQVTGIVALGDGATTIDNSGDIVGAIDFGAGANAYDGVNGKQSGGIYLGAGGSTVELGSDGETVYGGGGDDTINGTAGNDFIEIDRGSSFINGGGGVSVLSFQDSAASVVVNLSTGTASAAGNDTISDFYTVIASNFASTLIAGASDAELVGGAAYDTLTAGTGTDVLVSGTGGALMTAGNRKDTFVYSSGDHQVQIVNFRPTVDILDIYGYKSTAATITQVGANTVITLSATDSITLDNTLTSALTSTNLSYNTGVFAVPQGEGVAPPVFGSTTIFVTANLSIYADETLQEANQSIGLDDETPTNISGSTYNSIDNSGVVEVTAGSGGTVDGVLVASTVVAGGLFTNEAGAEFLVSDTSGGAYGFYASAGSPNIVNNGVYTVTASGSAYGAVSFSPGFAFTNGATGQLSVSSSTGVARGVTQASVLNNGTIVVSGVGAAYGVQESSLVNNGALTVTATGTGAQAVGVDITGTYDPEVTTVITNTGTITAQTAIEVGSGGATPADYAGVDITNSGQIDGTISLAGGSNILTNTGTISGNLDLGDGSTTVDDRGGVLDGVINIAPTGAATKVIDDTIYTGAGPTTIDLHASTSTLDLSVISGGETTIDLDESSTAATIAYDANGNVTVSAGADGTLTLQGVESLVFTNQTIYLPTVADDFNADAKSDILIENTNGAVVVGEVGSNGQLSYAQVTGLGPEWSFVGTGNFLGDGKSQFLIENTVGAVVTGEVVNGQTQYAQVGGLGPEWSFVGTGDYLGDGKTDFLIENTVGAVVTGEVVNGQAQYTQVAALGPEWSFVGSGDFLGDGKTDFLIENTNGAVVTGEVVNGQAQYTQVAGLGPEWSFVASGDFLGDGKTDFLIENTNGALVVGEVGANHQAAYTQIGGLGPEWHFVGTGDYGAAGVDSFLIENTNGAVVAGTVVNGQAQYAQIGGLGSVWKFHG